MPHPSTVLPGPACAADTLSVPPQASVVQLLQRLPKRSIPRPRSRPLYALSLWLVTALCALIPLLYLGLVVGVGWLEFRYYSDWVHQIGRTASVVHVLAWTLPGFVGGVLILFLLKPLFAPRGQPPRAVALEAGQEPEFVAAVHGLCAAMGIRPPVEIRLTHEVNAWVQFETGLFGFLRGRKTLTIGLPLVAGLSARQLVGVLAHEFGHFAQGAGMRCASVINRVNRWLESRAYHPDEWDDRLERWNDEMNGGLVSLACFLASLCLGLTRLLLRALFQISFRMSRRLSQEMEFDADRYEAIVAGSGCFRATALQMRALARAHRDTDLSNRHAWREGRLVDDLPATVAARLGQLREDDWRAIALDLEADHETRYWDSHPADQARIANAEELAAAGLFLDERPARLLLQDFATLSRRVTEHFYREVGLEFGPRNLIGGDELLGLNRLADALAVTWQRYSNGMLGDVPLLSPADAQRLPAAAFDWQGSVDELRRIGPEVSGLWQRIARLRERRDELSLWIALIDLDLNFTMPDGSPPDRVQLRTEYGACVTQDTPDLRLAERVLGLFARRLQHAMDVLPGDERDAARQRLGLVQSLHDLWPRVDELARQGRTWLRFHDGMRGDDEQLRQWIYEKCHRYRTDFLALLEAMEPIALTPEETLAKHVRNRCGRLSTAGEDGFRFLQVTSPLADVFLRVYRSQLAELAQMADRMETQHGIRPIRLFEVRKPAGEAAPV